MSESGLGLLGRRDFLRATGLTAAALALGCAPGRGRGRAAVAAPGARTTTAAAAAPGRPNIVFFMTDDQPGRTVGRFGDPDDPRFFRVREGGQVKPLMRHLMSGRGGGWTNFTDAYSPHAICAPSRATCLTGQYSTQHGVQKNGWVKRLDAENTLFKALKDAGYATGFFGKYSFKRDKGAARPAGCDRWSAGGGKIANVQAAAVDWMRSVPAEQPVFMCVWATNPHRTYEIAPGYRDADVLVPDHDPAALDFTPTPLRGGKPFSAKGLSGMQSEQRQMGRDLLAVDDAIGALIDELERLGRWDDTVFVFYGDNGYLFGEYGLKHGKDAPYPAAARVPLLVRVPGGGPNRDSDTLAAGVDIAPTLLALAGQPPLPRSAGRDLLAAGDDGWTDGILLERPAPSGKSGITFRAILTRDGDGRYAYVRYTGGATGEELYLLDIDPSMRWNAAGQPERAALKARLAAKLDARVGALP